MYKDAVLSALAHRANVAQFVSFSPTLTQRFNCVRGHAPNHDFGSTERGIDALLRSSDDGAVNIRSYSPDSPKSKEFVYGLSSVAAVMENLSRISATGLHTIVNETIDVHDGGVSGVMLGNIIEFMPGATPRDVEKKVPASLPRDLGRELLRIVYRFKPELDYSREERVEFSLHPKRRGYRQTHTIVWELENIGESFAEATFSWPNPFSQFVGDKAFGLLVAHLSGLPVPDSLVIGRQVSPFRFGRATGSAEVWLRTCPRTQQPGKYTTVRGWTDPFALLAAEDPDGTQLSSVIVQAQVDARYAGAAATPGHPGAGLIVEGVVGFGDEFMSGKLGPAELPRQQINRVRRLYRTAAAHLGPVRFEWASDEKRTWVLQLHRGTSSTAGHVIHPGDPNHWDTFHVGDGLEILRDMIVAASASGHGILVEGRVGVTSHVGDLLRKARVPSRLSQVA